MRYTPGYSKVKVKNGTKFYGPTISYFGKTLHLKGVKKTASDALTYSRRFCARLERLREKEISGYQG